MADPTSYSSERSVPVKHRKFLKSRNYQFVKGLCFLDLINIKFCPFIRLHSVQAHRIDSCCLAI